MGEGIIDLDIVEEGIIDLDIVGEGIIDLDLVGEGIICSGPWKLESSRRLCWRGMLGKSEKGCREFGMGRGWGGVEKGETSSRVTWNQGGRDPIMPRRISK